VKGRLSRARVITSVPVASFARPATRSRRARAPREVHRPGSALWSIDAVRFEHQHFIGLTPSSRQSCLSTSSEGAASGLPLNEKP
jgi:hypothetical protein